MSCPTDEAIIKDPNATLDYVVDWSAWLTASGADTIASVAWTATGLTVSTSSFTTTTAAIWLSGGTVGMLYDITCRITTAAGRIEDFTFQLRIREK